MYIDDIILSNFYVDFYASRKPAKSIDPVLLFFYKEELKNQNELCRVINA